MDGLDKRFRVLHFHESFPDEDCICACFKGTRCIFSCQDATFRNGNATLGQTRDYGF